MPIKLQPLQNQLSRSTRQPRLPRLTRTPIGPSIGAIHQTAFARASCPSLAGSTRLTRRTTLQANLNTLLRIALRQGKTDAPTGRAVMAIAAIVAISPTASLPPGATTGLAIGAIEADIPRRPSPTASIDRQPIRLQRMQLHIQIAPRSSSPLIAARRAWRTDLTAFGKTGTARFDTQGSFSRRHGNSRITAKLQLIDFQRGQRRR